MMRRKRKSGGISFKTAILLVLVVALGVVCLTRYSNIYRQKQKLLEEKRSLESQSEALSEKLMRLRMQEEMGQDDQYIESVARSRLDMVYPGEVIFRVGEKQYG